MRIVEQVLRQNPKQKRAQAYKLVLGDLLEIEQATELRHKKIPPRYETYWKNHPRCIPNENCDGLYFVCKETCPPPGPKDKR